MTAVDVLVVGAGFAGIGTAIRLAREGVRSFVVLERSSGVGGTWWDNSYPGVACDVPSHLYSFSFRVKPDWSRTFAPGAEIRDYLADCVREEGVAQHIRLNTEMTDARWDESAGRWRVSTTRGEFEARALVMAAGRLSEPRIPSTPGLESFPGPMFHSARWRDDVDLRGARVGVVGSGASAVQIVPRVAEQAGEVVLFQRSAPYVMPRGDRVFGEEEKAALAADPRALRRLRDGLFWSMEEGFAARAGAPGLEGHRERLRSAALGHLESAIADPVLRAALTPDYEVGCKRVLLSDDYYPALTLPHVSVVPAALESVSGSTVRAKDGTERDVDVLVLATGFHSTRPPFAQRVTGRDGLLLADHWSDGMTAYASTTVHGFPGLFIINGPNASLGHNSAIAMIEAQIDYVLAVLEATDAQDADALEPTADAERASRDEVDALAASTVWMLGGCESWYLDSAVHRLTLVWPDFAHTFRERLSSVDLAAYEPVRAAREGRPGSLRL
ncbi:NAD(P)/FAD-dependent oxidoreductase [Humibacter sp. BT305]|nr:NAD(P)/FAD-dependent oxidoreductase [Humibacter sp. BT305]